MQSSISLPTGTLTFIATASAPSATAQVADASTPASASSSDSGTPVHSLHETMPWNEPTGRWIGTVCQPALLLPPHSMKISCDRIG